MCFHLLSFLKPQERKGLKVMPTRGQIKCERRQKQLCNNIEEYVVTKLHTERNLKFKQSSQEAIRKQFSLYHRIVQRFKNFKDQTISGTEVSKWG